MGDWRDLYPAVRVLRAGKFDDRDAWIVELGGGEAPDATAWVDADTGDILRIDTAVIEPSSTLAIPLRIVCEDFRDVEGLRIPFRIITSTEITGQVIVEFDEIQTRLDVGESFFVPRAPDNGAQRALAQPVR